MYSEQQRHVRILRTNGVFFSRHELFSLSLSLSCDDDDDDGASTEFLPAEVERSVIRVEKSMVDRVFLLPSACCPRCSLALRRPLSLLRTLSIPVSLPSLLRQFTSISKCACLAENRVGSQARPDIPADNDDVESRMRERESCLRWLDIIHVSILYFLYCFKSR